MPDLKISYFQTSIPDKINVALKPEELGKSYILTVTNKFKESGSYVGKIELFTNYKKRDRLLMRVFGDFPPPGGSSRTGKSDLPKQQGAGMPIALIVILKRFFLVEGCLVGASRRLAQMYAKIFLRTAINVPLKFLD